MIIAGTFYFHDGALVELPNKDGRKLKDGMTGLNKGDRSRFI